MGTLFTNKKRTFSNLVFVHLLYHKIVTMLGSDTAYARSLKLVLVGDAGVGKTCALITYCWGGNFPVDYVPTVFENFE